MTTKRNHARRTIGLVPPELPGAGAANAISLAAERRTVQVLTGLGALLVVSAFQRVGAGPLGFVLVAGGAIALVAAWCVPRVARTCARTRDACARTRAGASTWRADAHAAGHRYAAREAARRGGAVRAANAQWQRIVRSLAREGITFPGDVRVLHIDNLPPGRRFTVVRTSQAPTAMLERHLPAIAAGFRAGSATMDVGAGRARADMAWIQLHERDPFDQLQRRIPWPAIQPHSVLDPLPLGRRGDGTEATLRIRPGAHTLIAGTTGGGKDNTTGLEVAWVAYAPDAELYVIDMKGGLDWSRWRHACVAFGTDDQTARQVLAAFLAEMRRRERHLVERGLSKVTIGVEDTAAPGRFPLMKLVVSEVLELDEKCWAMLGQIVRLCRAMGGSVTLNTQEPRMEAMRDRTVRANLPVRIALPCREAKHYTMILGRDATDEERRALTRPGRAIVSVDGKDETIQAYWIGDGDREDDPVVRIAKAAPKADRKTSPIPDRNPNPEQGRNDRSESSEQAGVHDQWQVPASLADGGKGPVVFAALCELQRANTVAVADRAGVDWKTAATWLARFEQDGAIRSEARGRERFWSPCVAVTYDADRAADA